jgi:RNA polymerase sigma factor (sigma-70 family)
MGMLPKPPGSDLKAARPPDDFEMLPKPSPRDLRSAWVPDNFEAIYSKNSDVLKAIAIRKFHVPAYDAEALVHEVFLSYLARREKIADLHKWLLGSICIASRYYWRQHGRNIEQLDSEVASARPDPASISILDTLTARIAAGEALSGLSPRYQHILRLRYFEGYSINELAEHLGVTTKYTQRLVTKCLRRAEELLVDVDRTPRPQSENQDLGEIVAGFVDAYRNLG